MRFASVAEVKDRLSEYLARARKKKGDELESMWKLAPKDRGF